MSSCCQASDTEPGRCLRCGNAGSRVTPITLKALLTSEGLRLGIPETPRACLNPKCPVVYFDNAESIIFSEDHLTVRYHAKHPENVLLPICYCFGVTRSMIENEIRTSGRSTASIMIAREVRAGHCACEVRNPKGTCCLGDVSGIERAVMSQCSSGESDDHMTQARGAASGAR